MAIRIRDRNSAGAVRGRAIPLTAPSPCARCGTTWPRAGLTATAGHGFLCPSCHWTIGGCHEPSFKKISSATRIPSGAELERELGPLMFGFVVADPAPDAPSGGEA